MNKLHLLLISLFLSISCFGQYPSITGEGFKPLDKKFKKPIDKSKTDELTIASFNLRNIKGTKRTLEDIQYLMDLVNEADLIVFQEIGAYGFKNGDNSDLEQRIEGLKKVFEVFLGGDNWKVISAPKYNPVGKEKDAEIPMLAYKKKAKGFSISASWKEYYEIGDKRDLGVFDVTCKKGSKTESFELSTIHTKPDCPHRGEQLLGISKYIEEHKKEKFIIAGDFNWGYESSCPNGYEGEEAILEQHNNKTACLLFNDISYLGKKDAKDHFRTNLSIRKGAHFYDQFVICNSYSSKLADGGKLLQDCGFVSFSKGSYYNDKIKDEVNLILKGAKKTLKAQNIKL
ncbi:MAG: hypothetical protein HRT73_14130, partial [Flavobacteriales bacterium]|nr:hypothetical protein [Flavobacteriales bacterium]